MCSFHSLHLFFCVSGILFILFIVTWLFSICLSLLFFVLYNRWLLFPCFLVPVFSWYDIELISSSLFSLPPVCRQFLVFIFFLITSLDSFVRVPLFRVSSLQINKLPSFLFLLCSLVDIWCCFSVPPDLELYVCTTLLFYIWTPAMSSNSHSSYLPFFQLGLLCLCGCARWGISKAECSLFEFFELSAWDLVVTLTCFWLRSLIGGCGYWWKLYCVLYIHTHGCSW